MVHAGLSMQYLFHRALFIREAAKKFPLEPSGNIFLGNFFFSNYRPLKKITFFAASLRESAQTVLNKFNFIFWFSVSSLHKENQIVYLQSNIKELSAK